MMPTAAIKKALTVVTIMATTVLVGCSSRRTTPSETAPSSQLTGTMNDWTNAVCDGATPPMPMGPGRYMGGATNPMTCRGLAQGNGVRVPVPILIGTYTSQSLMGHDLVQLGAYAEGNDGTQYVVFGSIPTSAVAAEATVLKPLQTYGFEIVPSPDSAATTPPSLHGNPNAMPPPIAISSLTNAPARPGTGGQTPADADLQGFLGYPGARCNYTNQAVVIAPDSELGIGDLPNRRRAALLQRRRHRERLVYRDR